MKKEYVTHVFLNDMQMFYLLNSTYLFGSETGQKFVCSMVFFIMGPGSNPKDACTSKEVWGYLEGNQRRLRKGKEKINVPFAMCFKLECPFKNLICKPLEGKLCYIVKALR